MDNPFKARKTDTPRKRRFPLVRTSAATALVGLGIAAIAGSVRKTKSKAS